MFKTVYTAHDSHEKFSVSGEKDRPNYRPQYAPNGTYELVEDGLIHSYDDVQAWLPQTDMGQIIERYIRTGDTALLNRRAAFYADVSDMPRNYAELHNCLQNADRIFLTLPLEVREEFGNSPAMFYSDGEKAREIIGKYVKKVTENNKPSVDVTPAQPVTPVESVVEKGSVVNE